MSGKSMEPHRRGVDRQGDSRPGADSTIKQLWVGRAVRFIDKARNGIDTWPADGQRVPVTDLVNAYMTITAVLDPNGQDAGRVVEFYMMPRGTTQYEHMASLLYGPPREGFLFRRNRLLLKTKYRV